MYKHSPYDFSVENVPISVGQFERVLRNNLTDVGRLFEFMAPILFNTPGVRAGKFWFTLVNVTCTHNQHSFGLSPEPHKDAQPMGATWLFTFALTASGYGDASVPRNVLHLGTNVRVWGRSKHEFLTIGITHSQAQEFGMRYDTLTPQWLYYLIGAMTKNFVLRSRYHTTDDDFSSFYNMQRMTSYRATYHMMPTYTLVRNVPYHLWIFNRTVWRVGMKLLSPRHITFESLMFMCRYVQHVGQLPTEIERAVIDKFHESLTDLIQRREHNEAPTQQWQLLYAALCNRGSIPTSNVEQWLTFKETEVSLPSGDYSTHILNLVYA